MIWKFLEQRAAYQEVQSRDGAIHRQQWTAPAAANTTYYLSAHNLDGSTFSSFASQPSHPRNVQIVASGVTAANVTINGLDIRGNSISETLALNGTTAVAGNKAFKSITSIVLPTVASTTISVGTGVKFGLDRNLLEASVLDTYTDGVRDTTPAAVAASGSVASTSICQNTVSFATAPNGSHNYAAYVATTELTDASGTTA